MSARIFKAMDVGKWTCCKNKNVNSRKIRLLPNNEECMPTFLQVTRVFVILLFSAKEVFRDFVTKYPVSGRSFDQITRILGIFGEVHGVVAVAMHKKDRKIEKLEEVILREEKRFQESKRGGSNLTSGNDSSK